MRKISQSLRNLLFALLVSISLLFVSSCSSHQSKVEPNLNVVIEVVFDEHVSTSSTNPQIVRKGETANFKLDFANNFKFFSSSNGTYDEETSILSIPSDMGNMTTKVTSVNTSGYTLQVLTDANFGGVTISPSKEFYLPEDKIEITASSDERDFLCYTFDMPYRNGTKGISGVPISFDNKTTISISKDTVVYANYFYEDSLVIDYDLNGGRTKNGYTSIHTDSVLYDTDNPYFFRNTINLSSYAFRDGYILDSLNTKKDGSGTRIGIGSRINTNLFTNNHLTLYAEWVKCTSSDLFVTHELDDDKAEITSFNGFTSETLAIPSIIKDKEIIGIKSGAFTNLSSVKSLYLPDTIEYVEDNAFVNMSSLTELHLFTSIERISKQSFAAPKLKTLYINKNTYPLDADTAWDNLSVYKEAILNQDQSKSNVIAVGHSTIRLNHDLSPLVDAYGDNYNFYIYGAVAGMDGYLLLTSLMDILRSNDYIILPMWPLLEAYQDGPRNFTLLQYDLDSLLTADYAYIKDFIWESFVAYRDLCTKQIGVNAYQIESHNEKSWNSTGGNNEGENVDDPNNGSGQYYDFYLKDRSIDKYLYLHSIFDRLPFANDHILMTWNPYNQNCLTDLSGLTSYEEMIRNEFNTCSFFDTQMDNLYPGNYFLYDDFFHLSPYGASKRIEKWVGQLSSFFAI
ncbi:MAG: leucine-rich repeat protein [Bacilli bacterium]|nr:leucine-rich repeat protein [Bacilli bacterium]